MGLREDGNISLVVFLFGGMEHRHLALTVLIEHSHHVTFLHRFAPPVQNRCIDLLEFVPQQEGFASRV